MSRLSNSHYVYRNISQLKAFSEVSKNIEQATNFTIENIKIFYEISKAIIMYSLHFLQSALLIEINPGIAFQICAKQSFPFIFIDLNVS